MSVKQNIKVTADTIVFGEQAGETYLLLIQRKNDPFKDKWAFPGGFVEDDEDLILSAVRELEEETGIRLETSQVTQLGAWGKPGRDPRGRTITVAFMGTIDMDEHTVSAADDAKDAKWWNIKDLPALAFDHSDILQTALHER